MQKCTDGWVEFTCKYPKTKGEKLFITGKSEIIYIYSMEKNVWEDRGSMFLYQDTKQKHFRVVIRQVQDEDIRDYKCGYEPGPTSKKKKQEFKVGKRNPLIN